MGKHGAVCNTDYRMLWVKLRIGRNIFKHRCRGGQTKRYDVVKFQGPCVDMKGRVLKREGLWKVCVRV